MIAKTVINIHPKVFYGVLAGAGFSIATAVAQHIDPSLFNFLPVEYRPAAVTCAGILLTGIAGWLKKSSADETSEQKKLSDDIAQTVQDAIPVVLTVTATSDAPPAVTP